jgi:hypothetical protein
MNLDHQLKELFDIIREEARQNLAFSERLAKLFNQLSEPAPTRNHGRHARGFDDTTGPPEAKRGNRRAQGIVDPVAEIQHGEDRLRGLLGPLNLEQLRDIVAEYRMDPNKLVMKWKDRERIIEHIIETAINRGRKGDAFRA